MMKRKPVCFAMLALLLLFCTSPEEADGQTMYTEEFEAFRQLPAEEKVQKMLEELRYKNLAGNYKYGLFLLAFDYNVQETIPVLLDYLERTEMIPPLPPPPGRIPLHPPLLSSDNSFKIIDYIVHGYMGHGYFNRDELARLRSIYQQKIHEYLTTYKLVDVQLVLMESNIEAIDGKLVVTSNLRDMADALYDKYTKLGHMDLRVNYRNL
jgi:hypothetical protein